MSTNSYRPEDYGKEEVELTKKFIIQRDDAKRYFEACIKPRLDRSYKLYVSYNGDRAKEIQSWQSNIFVPYIHSVVETLMPRILDARPEFSILGRTEDDHAKSLKLQQLADYTWEKSRADKTAETVTRAALIYGTGFLQVSWKKDVRELKFLKTKDLTNKKYKWENKEQVFYDAPFVEWVDNYDLWYDWHNVKREQKQFWLKRLVLTEPEIRRRYPMADETRLKCAFEKQSGELNDYASLRNEVRSNHEEAIKGADRGYGGSRSPHSEYGQKYDNTYDQKLKMHETFEWWRPFDDFYAVMINDIPVFKNGFMPNPYNFKESPFIDIPYLGLPGEFEGYGLPMILENPQLMLNMIKNQRLDAATLNIHKMWVVNPLANVNREELVTRPFGIVWSTDPNGVREIQFSDIKQSAYKEEELLKGDMRYASGVDDFSMGVGGGNESATAVRHLRESTLERVRLFVNHLGEAFSDVMRYWISMYNQFFTEDMQIRIIGDDGKIEFPIIEKDDLMGEFDFKSAVVPAIAGQQDVKKKQDMDLFQLLVNMPFVDPRKLTAKILYDWNWSLDGISKNEEEEGGQTPSPEEINAMIQSGQITPEMAAQLMGGSPEGPAPIGMPEGGGGRISPDVINGAMKLMGNPPQGGAEGFKELGMPINLLQSGQVPPTAAGIPTSNPRGLNRKPGGKVNTNIPVKQNNSTESNLLNRAFNTQR